MKSQNWTLIRKIAATTSFAFLAMGQTAMVQSTFAQESFVSPQVQTDTSDGSVKATIRLRTEDQQGTADAGQYDFAPVPAINQQGIAQPARKRGLLDARFSGFPKAGSQNTANPIAAEKPTADKAVAPVAWNAPATTGGIFIPASTAVKTPIPSMNPVQDLAPPPQDDPENPLFQGLSGPVQIVVDDVTGKLNVLGSPEDVAIVEQRLNEILESAEEEVIKSQRVPLRFSQSEEISDSIRQIYDENYEQRVGKADIVPLQSPNSLLVVGSQTAIDAVREIVNEIESDVSSEETKSFATFPLKHLSAIDAKRRLEEFFSGGNAGAAFPVGSWTVVADYRSNTVVVRGDTSVQQQAKLLIAAMDVDTSVAAKQEVKVFQLQNAAAGDLAIILFDAINGTQRNVPQPLTSTAGGGGVTPAQPGQTADEFGSEPTPARLQLQTIGGPIESGVLFNVRITPDTASNSLIVRGPVSAMPLVTELVKQLDRLPNAETMLKVFHIVNGDAEQLLTMLESIFGADDQAGQPNVSGALAQLPLQTASATPGSALVNLRFAIDQRTNSIIATGPGGDLQVVEDLLNRLDEDLNSRRETVVYRLSNSNVLDVAEALNDLLDSRSDILAQDPRAAGGAVLSDQEIVIVPELGSNSLMISSVPENFPEIENIIRRLDRRPPMVKVKVMMAEVDLGSLEEFGVELGVQDSLLFDRGTTVGPGGAITGNGFNFNQVNGANANSVFPGTLAGQALSNLGVGRTNAGLGYGGLVLSAGNESIEVLLRALKDRNSIRVLSRPHIMTLENLQGRVSVGQIVSRIGETNQNGNNGQISNSIDETEIGVILEMTPRVSPDGMITMFLNIVKSDLGQEADGPAVAVAADGTIVRQAPINATEAQTTILSRSGQTVVLSGLIQETKEHVERGAPILSDLPIIGPLFKFEQDIASRSELLIIMTPYLVDTDGSVTAQNADEMERMHWCECDVAEIYGNTDFDPVHADMDATRTVYPGEGEVIDEGLYFSEKEKAGQEIDRISQTEGKSRPVRQVGFLDKMKLSLKQSPVAKIADRIRGNNVPNQNSRNRQDFEDLKRLRSQRQE